MTDPGPYAEAAQIYWHAGWRGIIPVPARTKRLRLTGWTGEKGAWPSYADIYDWSTNPITGDGNIALRLPHHILGIDVDDYDGKGGGATLQTLTERFGSLPATWRSTSRDDGTSGILFFIVPEGLAWPANITPGIEIIQYRHRYAVVWPSIHPEGRTYRWITPGGATSTVIPAVDELPELPDTWIVGLTGGEMATPTNKATITLHRSQKWLLDAPQGPQCPRMTKATTNALHALTETGSRHDTTMSHQLRLVRYAEQGHHGVLDAVTQLHAQFITEATKTGAGQRSATEAEAEWSRGLTGAVATVIGNPGARHEPDNCCGSRGDDKFTGLIDLHHPTAAVDWPTDSELPASDVPSSWEPVNLTPYLDGTYTRPEPGVLIREDGVGLLYPSKVHWMHGESESGKSWCAQIAAVRVLAADGRVLYLDHESDPQEVITRFLSLGADPAALSECLVYVRPDDSSMLPRNYDQVEKMFNGTYDLAVIDGVTDALGLDRASTKDTDDVAAWMRRMPRRIATRTGAAVVAIDHVTKDPDSRGRFAIGSQAKMAGIDGAAFVVEPSEPLGEGLLGEIVLRVAKDRPGSLRRSGGTYRKADRTQEIARIVFDSRKPGVIDVRVNAPGMCVSDTADATGTALFRPTKLMERVSVALEQHPEGLSGTAVQGLVSGRKSYVLQALDVLVSENWARRTEVQRGSSKTYTHYSVRVYREMNDLVENAGTGGNFSDPDRDPHRFRGLTPPGTGGTGESPDLRTGSGNRSGTGREPVNQGKQWGTGGPATTGSQDRGTGDFGSDHEDDQSEIYKKIHDSLLEKDLALVLAEGPAPVGFLAERIGADVWDLDHALDRLTRRGLVIRHAPTTGPPTFSLPPEPAA